MTLTVEFHLNLTSFTISASGPVQVRVLRGVQEHLLRHPRRGELLPLQDLAVPRRLRLGRVLRRHRPQSHGVRQGELSLLRLDTIE